MTAPTEADRLLAQGAPVTLLDGREVRLRYTMRSLKAFEDAYGSIEAAQKQLAGLFTGENAKRVTTVVPIMAMGLMHEGISEDQLYDLTVPTALPVYLDAIASALEEAFPEPSAEGKADATDGSPGGSATTSPPSGSGATTNGSGA